jgi:hypothetical protein
VGEGELFPESPTKFFVKAENVQVEFYKDPAGVVTHAEVRFGGKTDRFERLR